MQAAAALWGQVAGDVDLDVTSTEAGTQAGRVRESDRWTRGLSLSLLGREGKGSKELKSTYPSNERSVYNSSPLHFEKGK